MASSHSLVERKAMKWFLFSLRTGSCLETHYLVVAYSHKAGEKCVYVGGKTRTGVGGRNAMKAHATAALLVWVVDWQGVTPGDAVKFGHAIHNQ